VESAKTGEISGVLITTDVHSSMCTQPPYYSLVVLDVLLSYLVRN
jgi:hypothetical protein